MKTINPVNHLAMITGSFPSRANPEAGAFIRIFAHALARQGPKVTVINPISMHAFPPGSYASEADDLLGEQTIKVMQPSFLSFGVRPRLGLRTAPLTQWGFQRAVWKALCRLDSPVSHLYGHFLYPAGRSAVWAAQRLGIPSIAAVGEGAFWTVDPYGFEKAIKSFSNCSGFMAFSTPISNGLSRQLSIMPEKIRVFPNGVDLSIFSPLPRSRCREDLRLDPEAFFIAFIGTFNDLKGGPELLHAVHGMEGARLLLLGQGPLAMESPLISFKGVVPHAEIPRWLSAADIFVLPTREEGSCNAVIEAMACGLPIVTSNGSYMDDIVDSDVALRVDPTDAEALREAILMLRNDPDLRRRMSEACLRKAQLFDINERARAVLAWAEGLKQPAF